MKKAKIHYIALPDEMLKSNKLQWFAQHPIQNIPFEIVRPDKDGNWINLAAESDWETFLPIHNKDKSFNCIFGFSSLGISTNRDEWVYDFNKKNLQDKMTFFISTYNKALAEKKENFVTEKEGFYETEQQKGWNQEIKWSEHLKSVFKREIELSFEKKCILKSNYRPFIAKYFYAEKLVNDRLTQNHYDIFGEKLNLYNQVICFSGIAASKPFQALSTINIFSLDFLEKTNSLPLFRYDKDGNRLENITDWALAQFQAHYPDDKIEKQAIFHYVYAVLHHPAYRQKYELNLKRDFPRIPFYPDFQKWASWGKQLMDLHIDYEIVAGYPLVVNKLPLPEGKKEKVILKADKINNCLLLTDHCSLTNVPPEAWDYKLGNRSALEWVLDQYKESKPSDPTIAAQFNTYRFLDYKAEVIELLMRVCTVSVETVRIVNQMP